MVKTTNEGIVSALNLHRTNMYQEMNLYGRNIVSKSDSNNKMSSASNLNAGASVFVPGTNEWKIPAKVS